ncbi:porin family protein [uncultured Duncaniella sp.]|jgi:hypothetical protein|uniref:porin family protein n=1 Tax=uncultured Duncaniella sp. TaxID=2768039 RepID=UPI002676D365|nr:porin family protein [uncultured Duncaniella sp.]
MKDLWQKKIQERLNGLEVEEPAGLWEAIEERCKTDADFKSAMGVTNKKPVIVAFGRRLYALAAVLALLLGFVGIRLIFNGSEVSFATVETCYADSEPLTGESGRLQSIERMKKIPDKIIAGAEVVGRSHERDIEVSDVDDKAEETIDTDETVAEKKDECESPVVESNRDRSPKCDRPVKREQPRDFYNSSAVAKKSSHLTFGLYASGGNAASIGRTSSPQPVSDPGLGIDQYMWADDPMLGIILFNRGSELKTSIKHRQPVRFGLSLRYDFNDRLGIESGLTYTKLDSDMREGSEKHYFLGNQSLHYVGIPVSLKYRLFTWKFIDLYASAGGMVEKCVSASQTKNYVIENVMKSSETDDIKVKPLQWSVNASAGVQFRLTKFMGVYAEPGIAYYFDDGSEIKTIYKEKPVNFNLNLGVRFEL